MNVTDREWPYACVWNSVYYDKNEIEGGGGEGGRLIKIITYSKTINVQSMIIVN